MSLKIFPWRKINLKNFSRAQFSKLRNGINGVGDFLYDTICSQNFVSIGWLVWKLLGDQNFTQTDIHTHRHTHTQTDTHTHTNRHTHRQTDTQTDTHKHTEAYFISLVFLRKCRNKTKKLISDSFPRFHSEGTQFKIKWNIKRNQMWIYEEGVRLWISQGLNLCTLYSLVSPNNFQTSYPINTKFWLHTVSYQISRTPLIPFLNFENFAREKFLKFIFLHLINMGKFSNLYYASDLGLKSLKFGIKVVPVR